MHCIPAEPVLANQGRIAIGWHWSYDIGANSHQKEANQNGS